MFVFVTPYCVRLVKWGGGCGTYMMLHVNRDGALAGERGKGEWKVNLNRTLMYSDYYKKEDLLSKVCTLIKFLIVQGKLLSWTFSLHKTY